MSNDAKARRKHAKCGWLFGMLLLTTYLFFVTFMYTFRELELMLLRVCKQWVMG